MTDTTTEQPPKIPGVRYRTEKRVRHVAVTFNGQTRVVPQEYTVRVPVPPLNLDRMWLRVVISGAVLFTTAAVAWSTSVIGGLLSERTTPVIAYAAAASFEALWILCLIVEWLTRRQPDRARLAKVIGWFGLAGVVAAIMADGIHYDRLAAGIVGSFVSVVAKALWLVVFHLFRVKLSDLGAAVLQQSREDMAVTGVLIEEQRRLNETAAYYEAIYGPGAVQHALAFHTAEVPQLSAAPVAEEGQPSAPSVPAGPPAPPAPPVPSAPSVPPAPPVPAAPSAPATAVPSAPSGQASAPAAAAPSAPDPVPSVPDDEEPEPGEQAPAVPIGTLTIASVVRSLLARDPGLRDVARRPELIRLAAEQLPAQHKADPKKFAQTVKRNLRPKDTKPARKAAG